VSTLIFTGLSYLISTQRNMDTDYMRACRMKFVAQQIGTYLTLFVGWTRLEPLWKYQMSEFWRGRCKYLFFQDATITWAEPVSKLLFDFTLTYKEEPKEKHDGRKQHKPHRNPKTHNPPCFNLNEHYKCPLKSLLKRQPKHNTNWRSSSWSSHFVGFHGCWFDQQ